MYMYMCITELGEPPTLGPGFTFLQPVVSASMESPAESMPEQGPALASAEDDYLWTG